MKLEQNRPALIARFLFIPILLFSLAVRLSAAEADLKPGDTVGPQNWEKVKGKVGENLLNRIREGYSFKVKEPRILNHQGVSRRDRKITKVISPPSSRLGPSTMMREAAIR